MEQRVLLIHEVATLLRIAPPTVYKYLAQTRQGTGTFPLPISVAGGKLRWNADDIERYIESRSSTVTSNNMTSTSERRKKAKADSNRQEAAKKAMERHRNNRATKEGR